MRSGSRTPSQKDTSGQQEAAPQDVERSVKVQFRRVMRVAELLAKLERAPYESSRKTPQKHTD